MVIIGQHKVIAQSVCKGSRANLMEPTTNLYLIRHGEAWAVKTNIVAGPRGDAGLTPLGRAQAEALRDRLAATHEIAADVLVASTLPRARQTAAIIAPAFDLPILWEDDVQEMRVGEADGMRLDAFAANYGVPDYELAPYRPLAPGGESWAQFMLRVGTTLDRIATTYDGKTVAIVCHGGVIDGSMICLFGLNTHALPAADLHTHNTSITHWERRTRPGNPRAGG